MTSTNYNLADYPPGLVAVPATQWMWTTSVQALFSLTKGMPPGSSLMIAGQTQSPAFNRNVLIEHFLSKPSLQWILFLDSDMTPDKETIPRLLSHNVDIASALCFYRGEPFDSCFGELPGEENAVYHDMRDLREVEWVGTGCVLVRRRVIEAMAFPYFEHTTEMAGEDWYFCQKAQKLGFKVHIDCGLCVGHMTARPVEREMVELYQKIPRMGRQMAKFQAENPKWTQAVVVGGEKALAALGQTSGRQFDTNGIAIPSNQ